MRVSAFTINSVNLYLISFEQFHLLFDTGFPGSSHELARQLRPLNLKLRNITHVMLSHFHVDHAGSAQEILDEGAHLIITNTQHAEIAAMEKFISNKWSYKKLSCQNITVLAARPSQVLAPPLPWPLKIIITAAHSADSIAVIFDNGATFTGDLKPESLLLPEDVAERQAWQLLREQGAKHIFPGHGKDYYL